MKDARLVCQIVLEENGSFTLTSIKVVVNDIVNQTRLEGMKNPQQNYANVSSLFAAIQQQTVDIATSSLV